MHHLQWQRIIKAECYSQGNLDFVFSSTNFQVALWCCQCQTSSLVGGCCVKVRVIISGAHRAASLYMLDSSWRSYSHWFYKASKRLGVGQFCRTTMPDPNRTRVMTDYLLSSPGSRRPSKIWINCSSRPGSETFSGVMYWCWLSLCQGWIHVLLNMGKCVNFITTQSMFDRHELF